MRQVIFITPWHGNTAHLVKDYLQAVAGGTVVAVLDAVSDETALALSPIEHRIVNAENIGFSCSNNVGWKYVLRELKPADDDIVCFVNSDVRGNGLVQALQGNVQHGALYGPSLQQQLVLGRWMPYLEGWCLSATVETWKWLPGPWIEDYSPVYWDDNAVCLSALQCDMALIEMPLPVQHIGGQSGGVLKAGEIFEKNRALFVNDVRMAYAAQELRQTRTQAQYHRAVRTQSDIQHHLPLLNALARGLVVELGTRSGNSTVALLDGVERRGGRVISVDIDDCSGLFKGHPLWAFLQGSSTDPQTLQLATGGQMIDVLLIDTEHTYEQVTAELELWAPHVKEGGWILAHDTETFPGVKAALERFMTLDPGRYTVTWVVPNNGMAVIQIGASDAASN